MEFSLCTVLVGHWTYEEEWKAGALGPGGKMTGVYDAHMILGGFFLQAEQTEKGAMGEIRNLEIDAYDPVNRNFTSDTFLSDGTKSSFTITVCGNTITWAGTLTFAGKQYQFKEPMVFAPDFMSATAKAEVSVDGKTWTPCPSPKLRTKAILIHVTCYTASLYVIDFTRALNSGEAQCPKPIGSAAPCGTEQWEDGWSDAFEPYNHGGEHYKDTPSDIIKLGRSYEPH